jgi:pyridoxal phosphate-dependent aminotransferase EpsN
MNRPEKRILLSVPDMGGAEEGFVKEAFATNWLSTVGPHLEAFEREFSALIGLPAVALGSGTAALHLGLRLLEVGPGDEVFCPTLTFAASCNPVVYQGARPVFLDSEARSWNLDPQLLTDALKDRAARNRLPKAVVVVDLFGQSADMEPILAACGEYEIPVLEDAAEALGATYKGKPAGSLAPVAAFSFNGNKIITTTGGGMLVAQNQEWVDKARFWSTQARDANPINAYEHSQLGYNYRLSNVLAGIGRGQLLVLEERVRQRRAVAFRYAEGFAGLSGIELMPQADYGLHTNWLSCFLVTESAFGMSRDELLRHLDAHNIEARPVWKPMHLQKLYADAECYGGAAAEDIFRRGICLPSSSSLSEDEQAWVIQAVCAAHRREHLK